MPRTVQYQVKAAPVRVDTNLFWFGEWPIPRRPVAIAWQLSASVAWGAVAPQPHVASINMPWGVPLIVRSTPIHQDLALPPFNLPPSPDGWVPPWSVPVPRRSLPTYDQQATTIDPFILTQDVKVASWLVPWGTPVLPKRLSLETVYWNTRPTEVLPPLISWLVPLDNQVAAKRSAPDWFSLTSLPPPALDWLDAWGRIPARPTRQDTPFNWIPFPFVPYGWQGDWSALAIVARVHIYDPFAVAPYTPPVVLLEPWWFIDWSLPIPRAAWLHTVQQTQAWAPNALTPPFVIGHLLHVPYDLRILDVPMDIRVLDVEE